MRKALISLALATSMLATPSLARDGSTYAGIEGGVLFPKDLTVGVDTNGNRTIDASEQDLARIGSKTGYDADVVLGHDFGMFRLEAEAGYKRAGLDTLTTSGGVDANSAVAGIQTSASTTGHVTAKSLMANGLVDLGGDGGANFYAGGGVGYGWVDLNQSATSAATPFVNDSDGGFAWQLIGGLRFPVSDSVDLGLKYRYFNVQDLQMLTPAGTAVDTDFRSHSVLASLLFNFGGAVAAPPMIAPVPAPIMAPPPPPPPPAPPQTRTCPDGSVVMMNDACPVPPPPPAVRTGERG